MRKCLFISNFIMLNCIQSNSEQFCLLQENTPCGGGPTAWQLLWHWYSKTTNIFKKSKSIKFLVSSQINHTGVFFYESKLKAHHFNAGVEDHYLVNQVGISSSLGRTAKEEWEIGKIQSLHGRLRYLGVWGCERNLPLLFVSSFVFGFGCCFFSVTGENNVFTSVTWDLSSPPATPPFPDELGRSRVILCDWEMEIVVWGVSDSFPIGGGSRNMTWSSFSVPLSCVYSCCFMRVFTVLKNAHVLVAASLGRS